MKNLMSEETPTVLVIDDMRDVGEITCIYLERHKVDTIYAKNPQKAIEDFDLLEDPTDIDCVVCDYDMPQMNGLEVLQKIRETNSKLPFILYTGKGSEEIASEAVTRGVTDYIQKDSGDDHYDLLSNRVINAVKRYRAETAQQRSVEKEILQGIKSIFEQNKDLDEKQQSLLEFGADYLDMPSGFISHISDSYQTLLTTHEMGNLDDDDNRQCPIEETYCERTVQMDEPLIISNISKTLRIPDESEHSGIRQQAYDRWGIVSYIGTKITVDGEVYGTICFIDENDTHQFDESDEIFIELLAQWLGYELSNNKSKTRLKNQRDNLEEFTALVRHDLKNPLTVCLGHIDLLKEKQGDNMHVNKIEKSVKQINNLLDEFSLLSKTIGELNEENLDKITLKEVAEYVWNNCVTDSESELIIKDNEKDPLEANEGLLRQILDNLFRNAIEHNDTPVTVTVKRTSSGITVSDNGSGIDEDAGDVFAKGISTSDDNTGYGLYITKKIVQAHGWEIDVHSDESGTTFTIDTLIEG